MLMKYHTGDSAEWIRIIYVSTVRGSGAWYCETYCIKTLSGDRQCVHQIITIS